jgi:hypothetical protein
MLFSLGKHRITSEAAFPDQIRRDELCPKETKDHVSLGATSKCKISHCPLSYTKRSVYFNLKKWVKQLARFAREPVLRHYPLTLTSDFLSREESSE